MKNLRSAVGTCEKKKTACRAPHPHPSLPLTRKDDPQDLKVDSTKPPFAFLPKQGNKWDNLKGDLLPEMSQKKTNEKRNKTERRNSERRRHFVSQKLSDFLSHFKFYLFYSFFFCPKDFNQSKIFTLFVLHCHFISIRLFQEQLFSIYWSWCLPSPSSTAPFPTTTHTYPPSNPTHLLHSVLLK